MSSSPHEKGRGSQSRPPNRFATTHAEPDFDHFAFAEEDEPLRSLRTEFFPDSSRSIVSETDSPDVGFRYSVNPYRGCEHGCAYCYARPTHEYLGLDAGLDFESKIFYKPQAAQLLRDWLARRDWEPQTIAFSGVTDCYQPAERRFRLTRSCLEVAAEARQPVGIVTKNALVCRDLDLLTEMAQRRIVEVSFSVTTLDEELARVMEPRTSSPSARLRAIRMLAEAGIPVRMMVAPVIPGLNDSEIPAILEAGRAAGAQSATYILLRLPETVGPVFREWLERTQPSAQARIEGLIQSTRGGKWNDSQFGRRMRGQGPLAEQIRRTFQVFARRHGLDKKLPPLDASQFHRPRTSAGQLHLF